MTRVSSGAQTPRPVVVLVPSWTPWYATTPLGLSPRLICIACRLARIEVVDCHPYLGTQVTLRLGNFSTTLTRQASGISRPYEDGVR